MRNLEWLLILPVFIAMSVACTPSATKKPDPEGKTTTSGSIPPTPTPLPNSKLNGSGEIKAYHISGNIDEASQEGDVCDVSKPFTLPGTLKFEFTPTSDSKGTYTYSGPFKATGSGPYEIFNNGKMLVSGKGCIMGQCADYSHDWKAKSIDPKLCGQAK